MVYGKILKRSKISASVSASVESSQALLHILHRFRSSRLCCAFKNCHSNHRSSDHINMNYNSKNSVCSKAFCHFEKSSHLPVMEWYLPQGLDGFHLRFRYHDGCIFRGLPHFQNVVWAYMVTMGGRAGKIILFNRVRVESDV